MAFTPLGIIFLVSSCFFLFVFLRVVFHTGWFKAWLKGMLAFTCLFLFIFTLSIALDFMDYRPFQPEDRVATLTTFKNDDKSYSVSLSTQNGDADRSYVVSGDMWQLDFRLIIWSDFILFSGMNPVYRLERLSGRYLSVEQEKNSPRSVYDLRVSEKPFDLWGLISSNPWLPFVKAKFGSGTYVPMSEGAVYSVYLSNSGLLVNAENEAASNALTTWQ